MKFKDILYMKLERGNAEMYRKLVPFTWPLLFWKRLASLLVVYVDDLHVQVLARTI